MTTPEQEQLYETLRKYPAVLTSAFENAQGEMARVSDATQQVRWSQEGLRIAQQTARAWEAAVEYFRVSPRVFQVLSMSQFLRWADTGATLCHDSPTVAAAFFRASPTALLNLHARHIPGWAGLGHGLFRGTWKSSNLAARFFELSPDLTNYLTFRELESFGALVEALSQRSYDLAAECLHLGQRVLPTIRERTEVISLARTLASSSWREVRGCFEAVGKINASIGPKQRAQFITLAERLSRQGMTNVASFIVESALALAQAPSERQDALLEQAASLASYTPEAVGSFLKSLPRILARISPSQVETWFQHGVSLLEENPDSGVAYFKLESARAEDVLDTLSSSIELEKVKGLFSTYSRALAGSSVELLPVQDLAVKNIGWVSMEQASTDGKRIFLPPIVDREARKQDNFAWLKVVTTHQVGHLEFGSFELEFGQPATLFKNLWPALAKRRPRHAESGFTTDMSAFFDLFASRQLASDIFGAVEDGRVDTALLFRYQGLASHYRWVQTDALAHRPSIQDMPVQMAMVELLVRLSLDFDQQVPVPIAYTRQARAIAALLKRVQSPTATVEDSAEATIRIYAVISKLPNDEVSPEDWEDQGFGGVEFEEGDTKGMVKQIAEERKQEEDEQEQPGGYESPEEVDFRGDFKPEMVQLLTRIRGTEDVDEEEDRQMLSQEMLEELLKATAELELNEEGDVVTFAQNLLQEQGVDLPPARSSAGYQDIPHQEERGGALDVKEPRSYVYDEWDFRANDYRPRWCIVQEKQVLMGETRFYAETLQNYSGLMDQIRRQFEAVKPEMYRKVKRLPEGEDVDLDDGIEALIDLRTGLMPDEKIYWRRNKAERDVGVVFLLDMSASTAEAVEEAKRDAEWDIPTDPAAYAAWLRVRRGEGGRRQYKRIIDVEKESMVLLMTALEMIGDQYGVYGFSGFGRENVEFYVIKEIEEALSDQVKSRLDKVSPLHATRMGPAIRHAATKLEQVSAKTKFLFVISDGRPQDRGYSREGVEKEYAVQDTRMALMEARKKDITPFCLTVDRQGHDYLRTMAGDMGYEVLPDVMELPSRLPYLYRRLTI